MTYNVSSKLKTCYKRGMKKGHISDDGLWTLTEVECMGNCATAPMVQINDDNYEDLTAEKLTEILEALKSGDVPPPGSQIGRRCSCPERGATTLKDRAAAAGAPIAVDD